MSKDLEPQIYAADSPNGNFVVGEKDGTVDDVKDMRRMGKDQQFRVGSLPPTCRGLWNIGC